jgi:ectoine hydroxylase-related dioxygenase (phytanoyl-CoA dioxygenase family)
VRGEGYLILLSSLFDFSSFNRTPGLKSLYESQTPRKIRLHGKLDKKAFCIHPKLLNLIHHAWHTYNVVLWKASKFNKQLILRKASNGMC